MILRQGLLVARGVWLEALRRKEIYTIVVLSCLLIGGLAQVRFFGLESLSKFYRETALRLMGVSTALTVIVLAARQLPREFEARTIYPLLARPIHRATFVVGKLLGVLAAGGFCLALFLGIYALGCLSMGAPVHPALLLQHALLQLGLLLILTSLCFMLSILASHDAAVAFGVLLYLTSSICSSLFVVLYDTAGGFGRVVIRLMTWLLPQLMLFDLSEKTVHGEVWSPLSPAVLLQLGLYALVFSGAYLSITLILFRKRPL